MLVARVGQLLEVATRAHQAGRLDEAEKAYREAASLAPDHPAVLHLYGLCRCQRGEVAEGVALIERAIERAPGYTEAHNNLGNILIQTGQLDRAAACFRRVIELAPGFSPAHNNLGVVLQQKQQFSEAAAAFRQAVVLDPADGQYWQNLGDALRRVGDTKDAIAAYRRAIQVAGGAADADVFRHLASCLSRIGDRAGATTVVEEWLAREPSNELAIHMKASLSGDSLPERASDGYVKTVFDAFADTFESKLQSLGYKAPGLLVGAVERALANRGAAGTGLDVLDAGCGTGLCAPLLRPMARTLEGVDLSPKMLDLARRRGLYDVLVEAELTAFLRERPRAYDVIVCADTLVYFGALEEVVAAAAAALRSGYFSFCVESEASATDDYRLQPHGRYCHAEGYVRKVVAAAGLTIEELAVDVIRKENDVDVRGLYVTSRAS